MKRIFILLLCLCPLCTCVNASQIPAEEKLVALTFDDGPSGRFTSSLLDGLAQRDVKATFLLCGYRIVQYPGLTQRIFEEGHEIGLHGYSHKSMEDACEYSADQEIRKTMALIPEGCPVKFLRTPGGACSKGTRTAAENWGLSILYWSVDPRDWATNDIAVIERNVLQHIQDGDVILLHDMSDSSVEAALYIIDELQRQGFRFVTVSQMAQEKGVTLVPGKEYARFGSN